MKITGVKAGETTVTVTGTKISADIVRAAAETTVTKKINVVVASSLDVTATIEKSNEAYSVSVAAVTENGIVSADKESASTGTKITLTAKADDGYELASYSVTDSKSNPITVENNTFTMPESNVTVNATFKATTGTTTKYHLRDLSGITKSGSYVLECDMTMDKFAFSFPANSDIVIDFNEHKVDTNYDISVEGGSLTLKGTGKLYCTDSAGYKHSGISLSNAATLTLQDSVTIENASYGVFLRSQSKCTFNMTGGTITNCDNGVFMYGNMENAGTFNMSGGTITKCNYAVFAYGQSGTLVNKTGGTLSENKNDLY